jgi:diguanylate cyclase (GGDEF)-like protein
VRVTVSADPFKTVFDVSATLTASLDLDEVFATIARQVGEALDVRSCDINEYDAKANTMTYMAVWAKELLDDDLAYLGTVVSLDERPERDAVIRAGDVLVSYLDDPGLDPKEREVMERYDEWAAMEIPLVYGDEVIGVLGVAESRRTRRFSDEDKELLRLFARPAAAAIGNARMYRAQRDLAQRTTALLDSSRAVASSFVLEQVLEAVAREAAQLIGCPACSIYEYDAERHGTISRVRYVSPGTARGPEVLMGAFESSDDWPDDYERMVRGETAVHHVDDPGISAPDREDMERYGERTTLSVPLRFGDQPIGVLYLVELERRREFTEHELELARAFGELASAAIHNARLFRRQEQMTGRLVGLFDTSRSITAAHTVDEVVRALYEEVRLLLPEDEASAVIWLGDAAGEPAPYGMPGDEAPPCLSETAERALAALAPAQGQCVVGARLAIPFAVLGEARGFIEIESGRRAFSDELVEILQIVVNHAAVAIENSGLYSRVQTQAITDGLTGLFNHRYFYERLEQECARARRYDLPLALLMIDIDDFKTFNDRCGHQRGDEVLRDVAEILQRGVRCGIDLPARYGGEEFAILLPHTLTVGAGTVGDRLIRHIAALAEADGEIPPPGAGAVLVGERLRHDIEESAYSGPARKAPARVTVSVGVAAMAGADVCEEELVECADKALYVAKRSGKNRVEVFA